MSPTGYHYCPILQMRGQGTASDCKDALAAAVFNVYPLGLCGGHSDPHHLASQLLPGGQAYPFLWKPPAYVGCGCSEILHSLCKSWYWNLPEGSGGCGLQILGKTLFCFPSQLPFEKNCGTDHVCQDDLGISFGFSG